MAHSVIGFSFGAPSFLFQQGMATLLLRSGTAEAKLVPGGGVGNPTLAVESGSVRLFVKPTAAPRHAATFAIVGIIRGVSLGRPGTNQQGILPFLRKQLAVRD